MSTIITSSTPSLFASLFAFDQLIFCTKILPNYFSAATFALFLCLPIFVNAQSEATLDQLLKLSFEEVIDYEVVTPTKSGVPLSKIPGSVSVITYQDIQRSAASTIPELLRLVPGINVRWNPMVQTIDARGFGSNPFTSKILLMIDGVPYNSWNKGGFPQHPGFDFFNINNVKHIEVVRGAGSALYGENALNGVINIITFSGEEFQSARAKLYTGENNAEELSLTGGKRIGNDKSVFAAFRASKGQLPIELWRDQDSDANAYDLFLKTKFNNLQLSYYRRQDNFEGFNFPLDNPAFPAGSVIRSADNIKQTINIFAGQYNEQSSDDLRSIQANVSYSNRDGSHCAACHAPAQDISFQKAEDHGYQFFANGQLGLHNFEQHDVILGAEYRKISAGSHVNEFHGSAQTDEHNEEQETNNVTAYNKKAFYLQDHWRIPGNQWEFIAGLRYDSETSTDLFNSGVYPRLALVGTLSPRASIRFNWSKAVRYPSFTELNQGSDFLTADTQEFIIPLATFEPNPELKPEKLESFELGFSYKFSKTSQVKIDLYENHIENSIVIAYPRFRFENHPGDAKIRGFDLEFKSKPNNTITTFANISYQHNEEEKGGVDSGGNSLEFTYAPKYKINAGIYINPRDDLALSLEASWRDEYYAPNFWYTLVFNEEENKPLDSYTYLNARIDYKPAVQLGAHKAPLTISIIGKNLLDETPLETLTGLGGKSAGREIFISFSYAWSM